MYGKRNNDKIKDKMEVKYNVWYVRYKKPESGVVISNIFTAVRFQHLHILGPIWLGVEKFSIYSFYFF